MKLFIIDWSKEPTTPLIDYCCGTPHKIVGRELADGGDAYKKTGKCSPDAIIINYGVKPAHGRQTAESIRQRKLTAEIPIYFIDGSEDDNEMVSHYGICLSQEELQDLLEN